MYPFCFCFTQSSHIHVNLSMQKVDLSYLCILSLRIHTLYIHKNLWNTPTEYRDWMYYIAPLQYNVLLLLQSPMPCKIDESVSFGLEQAMNDVENKRNCAEPAGFKVVFKSNWLNKQFFLDSLCFKY